MVGLFRISHDFVFFFSSPRGMLKIKKRRHGVSFNRKKVKDFNSRCRG